MRTLVAVTAVCCLLCACPAHAKARYMGLAEAVAVSDVVAEIEVTQSTPSAGKMREWPKRGAWSYGQKNTFRFIRFIKNPGAVRFDKDAEQTLYAQKTFICARASYAQGKYVAFLESTGENEWITVNHSWGGLKIDDAGQVERFGAYGADRDLKKSVPLAEAREAIAAVLLDGEAITCTANISPGFYPRFNRWVEGAPSQKFIFHVDEPPKENWPEGLRHWTRAFAKPDVLDKAQYEAIAKTGGTYRVTGTWTKGSLFIASIGKAG